MIELAYEHQVPMAIEYADHEATTRPINLEFHNKSLREMVEAMVKQDQQYRVSFSNGVVRPARRIFNCSALSPKQRVPKGVAAALR